MTQRIAIIGLGMAVTPHAKALLDLRARCEVIACAPSATRRANFEATFGLPTTGDLDAVFTDPTIAAVGILTPPNTHLDLVRRASAAGKHILLEKIGRASCRERVCT